MFFKIDVLEKFVNYTGKNLWWSLFLIKLEAWRPSTLGSSRPEVFCQIGILTDFALFTRKHLCCILFLMKLEAWRPSTLKSSHPEVFYEKSIRKNFLVLSGKHLFWSLKDWRPTTLLKRGSNAGVFLWISRNF